MSKKLLVFIIVLLVLILIYLKNSTVTKNQEISSPTLPPISEKDNTKSLFFQNQEYRFAFFKASPQDLSLIPNFKDKKNSVDIKNENNCNSLVNAGFYTTENKPIGLFKTNEELIKNYYPNLTFNGVFSISQQNIASIEDNFSDQNARLALQSGPILIKKSVLQKLTINNDKTSRRVILALNSNNEVYFLVIFRQDSKYLGPYLNDLPKIISDLGASQNLNLSDAINLDGGTASAFYSNETSLEELAPVGSFFCIK
ncbi:MAG: phosphodiester glycosidase family protein [Candidatus Woesebacteria bacterium]|nr:MAG: phosphodiester glycosidase family protein [Candidatus Woesebacteria bacterium]